VPFPQPKSNAFAQTEAEEVRSVFTKEASGAGRKSWLIQGSESEGSPSVDNEPSGNGNLGSSKSNPSD